MFESTKEDELGAQMIQELSVAVRAKADALAAAQGRAVKRVYGITTEGNFGEAYAIFALKYNPSPAYAAEIAQPAERDLTMMVPQHIVVSQRMTVIYELK